MAPETLQMIEQWANDILVWVGFGTTVGLLAKGIMPGRDPGGAVATLGMGVGGTVIGCGVFAYFSGSMERITPISPLGFVVPKTPNTRTKIIQKRFTLFILIIPGGPPKILFPPAP